MQGAHNEDPGLSTRRLGLVLGAKHRNCTARERCFDISLSIAHISDGGRAACTVTLNKGPEFIHFAVSFWATGRTGVHAPKGRLNAKMRDDLQHAVQPTIGQDEHSVAAKRCRALMERFVRTRQASDRLVRLPVKHRPERSLKAHELRVILKRNHLPVVLEAQSGQRELGVRRKLDPYLEGGTSSGICNGTKAVDQCAVEVKADSN
jgi:hypothetical protein